MIDRRAFLASLGIGIFAPQFGRWFKQGSGLLVPLDPVWGWAQAHVKRGNEPWELVRRPILASQAPSIVQVQYYGGEAMQVIKHDALVRHLVPDMPESRSLLLEDLWADDLMVMEGDRMIASGRFRGAPQPRPQLEVVSTEQVMGEDSVIFADGFDGPVPAGWNGWH